MLIVLTNVAPSLGVPSAWSRPSTAHCSWLKSMPASSMLSVRKLVNCAKRSTTGSVPDDGSHVYVGCSPAQPVKMAGLPSRFSVVMLTSTPALSRPSFIACKSSQLMLVRARFSDRSAGAAVAGAVDGPPKRPNVLSRFAGVTAPRSVPAAENDVILSIGPDSLRCGGLFARKLLRDCVNVPNSLPDSPVSPMSKNDRPSRR